MVRIVFDVILCYFNIRNLGVLLIPMWSSFFCYMVCAKLYLDRWRIAVLICRHGIRLAGFGVGELKDTILQAVTPIVMGNIRIG